MNYNISRCYKMKGLRDPKSRPIELRNGLRPNFPHSHRLYVCRFLELNFYHLLIHSNLDCVVSDIYPFRWPTFFDSFIQKSIGFSKKISKKITNEFIATNGKSNYLFFILDSEISPLKHSES